MLSISCSGFVATQNLFQDTRTWIYAPAASNLSVVMQRGGKWWSETLRLGRCRVVHLRAECAAVLCSETGLTGPWDRSDRWSRQVVPTGPTGW